MIHQKGFQEEIIVLTRYPEPGRSKTRLIPELGPEGAARIQRMLTEQVIRTARRFTEKHNLVLSLYFTGGSHQQMKDWLGDDLSYHDQVGSDLGQRMIRAFEDARKRGSKRIVLIGSDCPAIDKHVLTSALKKLKKNLLVLGPATDGGYYLIGANSELPSAVLRSFLTDIAWGTQDVFPATVKRARDAGASLSILKELHDIDLPQDLAYFDHYSNPQ